MKRLTVTEKQVLRFTGEGLAPKIIAQRMDLERSTVDTHRRNIMRKLRIDDRHQFQAFAVRRRKLW
ncbi:MAG: response regulator transcription factor [Pirellulaceae bacterium]